MIVEKSRPQVGEVPGVVRSRAAMSHSGVPSRLAVGGARCNMINWMYAAVTVYTLSPGRMGAIVAALVGLTGAVMGGRALARSAGRLGTSAGRRGAIVALVLGPIGLVIGGLVVATADGGVGTGNGLGGGVVAMVIGLIGVTLGGLALARSRRPA